MPDFISRVPTWRSSALFTAAIAGAWFIYSLGIGALYLATPPNPDSSIFDYMSWRGLQGDRLYVDVIEQNWPGAVWVHMLSTALFGNTLWAFRLLDYLLLLAACLAMYRLAKNSGFTWTSVIAPPLYQMMYLTSSPWLTGQRDAFGAHILLVVSAVYLSIRGAWQPRWMLLFGAACAFVVMIRPTYLLFPALIMLGELVVFWRDRLQRRKLIKGSLVAMAGFAGFLLVLILAGLSTGGLRGWYEAAILYNLTVYSGSAGVVQTAQALLATAAMWHWYLGFSAIGLCLWYAKGDRAALAFVMAISVTAIVSFLVQGKAFGYHLAGLLPVMALLAGQTIAWAVETIGRYRKPYVLVVIAALILLVAMAGTARKFRAVQPQALYLAGKTDQSTYLQTSEFSFDGIGIANISEVAAYLETHTDAQDTVLVWNRGVAINFLAARQLPVPFATVGALAEFRHEEGLAAQWISQLRGALRCTPPKYIVVGSKQRLVDMATKKMYPGQRSKADEMVASAMADHYRLETEIGGALLWRLDKSVELPCR